MPSFTNLVIAVACDSFEDFPAAHKGPKAENLLACWTGLWHPALSPGSPDRRTQYRRYHPRFGDPHRVDR